MVAKVSLGSSFGGSARYLMEGRQTEQQRLVNKQAEVLASNGIRQGSIKQMTADFDRQRTLNPDLGKAVWHAVLSFSAKDAARLTNTYLVELARLYMTRLGIEPNRTQWLLVRHRDRPHPHVHLVLNRVQLSGQTIDAGFCRSRSRAVAIAVAQEEGLTVSVDQPTTKRHLQQAKKPSEWKTAKAYVYKTLIKMMPGSTSLAELTGRLREYEIEVRRYPADTETDSSTQGVAFVYNGQFLKASQVDRDVAWTKLKKKLARNLANTPVLARELSAIRVGLGTASKAEPVQAVKPVSKPSIRRLK